MSEAHTFPSCRALSRFSLDVNSIPPRRAHSFALVGSGADFATIQIQLANGGPDPYKPGEFGDTLVIETRLEKQAWLTLNYLTAILITNMIRSPDSEEP